MFLVIDIMIQQQTILKVSDNSGAKTVKCIKVLGGFKKKIAKVGDIIIVTIKELRDNLPPKCKVKKGQIHKALIVRTKKVIENKNHTFTYFNDNAVILLTKKNRITATRILGPISKKLKKTDLKFGILSKGFV